MSDDYIDENQDPKVTAAPPATETPAPAQTPPPATPASQGPPAGQGATTGQDDGTTPATPAPATPAAPEAPAKPIPTEAPAPAAPAPAPAAPAPAAPAPAPATPAPAAPAPAAPAPAAPAPAAPAPVTPAPAPAAPAAPAPAAPAPKAEEANGGAPNPLAKINRELKERAIAEKAKQLGVAYIDLEKVPINPDLAQVIEQDKALAAIVVPFFRVGKKLRVAVADPDTPQAKLLFVALKSQGYLLNINLASDDGIKAALAKLFEEQNKIKRPDLVTQVDVSEIKTYEQELENLSQLAEKLKTVTADEGLNMLNVGAVKTGASDIHIQPEEEIVVVRFRIDGFLQKVMELDHKTYDNLINQLKYKAGMKLNIKNIPQDGRDSFLFNERKIDIRVSILPTEYGESVVNRLLDSGKGFKSLEDCKFINRNLDLMKQATKISHGMILITGPTGSGKTTTLYSMLQEFNQPDAKVITLEDPIEYHLKGITQSQINAKRGFTFAGGLRSILRQDPDVVMVGEIRDQETAETASQAALTGHVLLSTLHTNSALETIPRLINIGLPAFMVAPSIHMIVAQRLVRKLCEHCKHKTPITDAERQEIESVCSEVNKISPGVECQIPTELWHPRECKQCSHTGYKGRVPVHEILLIDDDIRELIMKNASLKELTAVARKNGMLNMKEDGILKVLANETTLEEVHRVTMVLAEGKPEDEDAKPAAPGAPAATPSPAANKPAVPNPPNPAA
jgi:type IV pilus assembly protein PilB